MSNLEMKVAELATQVSELRRKLEDLALYEQATTPRTPPVGWVRLYPKTDGKLYRLTSDGTETEIG